MGWLVELFRGGSVAGSVLILGLVAVVGLALGSLRVRGLGLGIAGVLFSGILFGHCGARVPPLLLDFVRDFGLILFVYCVGVQVGPGFRASLRRDGLRLNLLAAGLVGVGAVIAVGIGKLAHVPMPVAVGLFSGGTTNTPSLGAAQVALHELPGYTEAVGAMPGLGYAVAYPFGILGVIGTMLLMRRLFRAPVLAGPAGQSPEATRDFEASAPAGDEATSVQALPLFIGVSLGVLLGNIPFPVAGLPAPLRLGLAAGPMIVAMALSSVPRLGPLTWRLPEKANLLLRELGIVLFLCVVGLRAGERFVETLLSGDGFYWMANAALITVVPVALATLVARYWLGLRYHFTCGLLAGSMTDPPALAFASSLAKTRDPIVAYATVYPLTQLMRVLSAQLIVLLFVR
jgi:AspT/YidE/YbjL antiporter-like protein